MCIDNEKRLWETGRGKSDHGILAELFSNIINAGHDDEEEERNECTVGWRN